MYRYIITYENCPLFERGMTCTKIDTNKLNNIKYLCHFFSIEFERSFCACLIEGDIEDKINKTITMDFKKKDLKNEETAQDPEDHQNTIKKKRRIMFSLIILSLTSMISHSAFFSLVSLQSSLNGAQGLGATTLSIRSAATVVSQLFLSSFLVQTFGAKWMFTVGIFSHGVFVAANFYPRTYTLYPASVIVGLTQGLVATSLGVYRSTIALDYADLTGEKDQVVLGRFSGIFFSLFNSARIWGNLISSLVLQQQQAPSTTLNSTKMVTTCGANFCPYEIDTMGNETTFQRPEDGRMYTLLGIYLGFVVVAVTIVILFLAPVESKTKKSSSVGMKILGTMKLHKNVKLLLIISLFLYIGFKNALMQSDFTQSFVTCELGVGFVGYSMLFIGVSNTVFAYIGGFLQKYLGRVTMVFMAALSHTAVMAAMLFWTPTATQLPMFFVLPFVWGVGDAVWQTQLSATTGILFATDMETAFSAKNLWHNVGSTLAFALSSNLCMYAKVLTNLGILLLGIVSYIAIEALMKYRWQKEHDLETYNDSPTKKEIYTIDGKFSITQ
ncbi:unnamed protein product [Owenia fusiformis]|uniref:Uncharacterized protein n=1 Tax=Owenia fusiformis TaxID=6347 RepID=A0A8J1UDK5_OWEFU|nr:unnamed protein product [Owenia fusiformis]